MLPTYPSVLPPKQLSPSFQLNTTALQKQKSVSTSSFYPRSTINYRQSSNLTSKVHLQSVIQAQERETLEEIEKMKLTLQIKMQQLKKRVTQSQQEAQKIHIDLHTTEKSMNESYKNMHKTDSTKKWSTQTQKTIQNILQNSNSLHYKNSSAHITTCREHQQKYLTIQQKLQEQKSSREKQWQQLIDNVGGAIVDAETIIQSQKQDMNYQILQLERIVLDMQQEGNKYIEEQINVRKQQHQYMSKLIQRIMQKMLYY